jgi:polyribonucleotide nucleotidyltransferase
MAVEVVTAEIGELAISFETGRLAKQASGAVVVQAGDSMVLVTAVGLRESREGADFFPLTVDVEERMYAAGKIPGGFIKRESRPSDRATLTARMTDRPIRPLWPKGYRNETQVVATVLSTDQVNAFDILCINGASAALMISALPFQGPIGAVRIGLIDDEFVINPTLQEMDESDLDLIVAGSADAISMVESGAKEVDEETILEALAIAHDEIKKLCAAQEELRKKAGKEKWDVEPVTVDPDLLAKVESAGRAALEEATLEQRKLERRDRVSAAKDEIAAAVLGGEPTAEEKAAFGRAFDALQKSIIRKRIAVDKHRPDGRDASEIRPIACETTVAPRVHGSGLFTRGETQVMTLLALGTLKDAQRIDGIGIETSKRYIHHYNFPPFSVGETGFMRGPKRRDIGHGALAERALIPVIPDAETFPYTMRVVSEILESNGSSSMASVCGSTMALMDAGVPITSPVAGIAMGLIKEGDNSIVLTDIQGAEDHLGDMDFKVAGTKDGITALQMDIKITGVSADLLRQALAQAREARLAILESMAKAISEPRTELSPYAPQVVTVKIDSDQIGLIIGKGGETIRGLEEEFDCKIDIEEDGFVRIYASSAAMGEGCRQRIEEMTRPISVGTVYRDRKVVKTAEFGAFIELRKGTDGLLHASRISPGVRVDSVDQVLTRGDIVTVEVTEVDTERGRVGLKLVSKQENGTEVPAEAIGARYKEQFPNAGQGGGQRPPREGDRSGGGRERSRR